MFEFSQRKANLCLPDVTHLVLSAVVSCADEVGSSLNVWDCDIWGLEVQIPVGKFLSWTLKTLPGLPDCFGHFVNSRIQSCVTQEVYMPFLLFYGTNSMAFGFLSVCIYFTFLPIFYWKLRFVSLCSKFILAAG